MNKSTGNKTQENTSPMLSPLASTGLSGHSWRLFLRIRRSLHRHGLYLRAAREERVRQEPGSHLYQRAVSRPPTLCSAPPGPKTLAVIGVDTEIEMHGAALRHRQAVAQPIGLLPPASSVLVGPPS